MLLLSLIVGAAVWSVATAGSVCTLDVMEAMVASISNEVDDAIGGSLTAIRGISMQMKHLHTTMRGPPSEVDSPNNKVQQVLWNQHQWFAHVNAAYVVWEDSTFMGYFDNDGVTDLTFKLPNEADALQYFDLGPNGNTQAHSQTITISTLNTTERSWYVAAKANCLPDNNWYYDCKAITTPLYASASNGLLTLTLAQAVPNFEGKPLFSYNEGVYMYGLQGQSDPSDSSTKSAFAGVIATDVACPIFDKFLMDEVDAGGASVAYIMESSYDLVAVSDGSDVAIIDGVNALRLSAQQSKSPLIASTAQYLVSNKYLSDNTLIWNDVAITVRKYFKNSAEWYIVVVTNYSPVQACDYKSQKLVLTDVVHSTDSILQNAKLAGRMLAGGLNYEMFPNSKLPPAKEDLWQLNSSTVSIQNMLIAVAEAFPTVYNIYVGYEDDTSVGFNLDATAEGAASFNAFTYTDSSDHVYRQYYACPESGYAARPSYVGPSKSKPGYYPTQILWYSEAVKVNEPIWSPPYFFNSDGTLGMTYSIPFYDNIGNLAGVIGVDIGFSAAAAALRRYGNSGTSYYLMETDESTVYGNTQLTAAFNMLMSSSDARVVNDAGDEQVKAWDADGVKDYMVATSAKYMKSTEFVYNGQFATGPLECSVYNYAEHGLHWRFVGVSYQYPVGTTTTTTDSSNSGSNGDSTPASAEDYDVIVNISNTGENMLVAIIMVVTFHFVISIATFFQGGYHRAHPAGMVGLSHAHDLK